MQIAELRKEKGLSQSKLAELTEISVWTIRAYEQGTRDIGSIELKKALALANALNCSLYDLLTD